MMDEEFDDRIKEICDGIEETPDAAVWEGIQHSLAVHRRRLLRRRLAVAVASMAAAVLAGLVVVTEPWKENMSQPVTVVENTAGQQQMTAQVLESEMESFAAAPEVQEVVYAHGRDVTAAASSGKASPVTPVPEAEPDTTSEQPSEAAPTAVPSEEVSSESIQSAPAPSDETLIAAADIEDIEEDDVKVRRGTFGLSASSDFYTLSGSKTPPTVNRTLRVSNSTENEIITPVTGEAPQHSFPISVSLGLTYTFLKGRMAVGTGLNYTYLRSKYTAFIAEENSDFILNSSATTASVTQQVHYLGIPLTLSYNIVYRPKFLFYAFLGGMMEKGVQANYDLTKENQEKESFSQGVSGVQWSVNAGIGVEYRFIKWLGIYLDPRVSYFFDNAQPFTVRTEQPFQVDFNLGFRFHL